MKKLLSMVLTIALLLSMMPATIANAASEDDTTFSAVVNPDSVAVGETVQVAVNITENPGIMGAEMEVVWPEGTFEFVSSAANSAYSSNSTVNDAKIVWMDANNIETTGEFFVVTLKALAAGTHTISLDGYVTDYDAIEWTPTLETTTVSVTDASTPTSEYTANISTTATDNTVVNGQDIEVKVNVAGTTGNFSSAEIVLDYDPGYLTYKSATTSSTDAQDPDYDVDTTNGTLTIRDYGEAITAADGIYTVTFTAAKGGNTTVKLMSAGFSTEKRAETLDLLAATGLNALDVTINHKVTVNNGDAGSVAPGGSYEYQIPNYDGTNKTYDITVTMGGDEQSDPTIGTDGKFTISSVTGDLVITYTVTANTYNVTWSDDDNAVKDEQQVTTVIHGNDITFDVPANLDPVGTTDGYKYVVTVTESQDTDKTIAATSASNTSGGLTYTVNGDLIEADITITIVKETVAADTVTVTVNGSDLTMKDAAGKPLTSPATVAKGDKITLVLNPETGYTYEVKVGEDVVTLTDNEYELTADATVIVTVTKTLDKTFVDVTNYLTLNGTNMWLVTINGSNSTQIEGKTYSYDGGNMYWSEKYQAYCYLVVAESLDIDTAKAAINETLVARDATAVDYTMDVNISNTMDVNDAQLVWNMYSAQYSDFTTNVTMEKFLRADVNGSKTVDTTDAAAIISAIKNA